MHYFAQNFQNFSGPQNPPLTFPPPISNFWIRHWPDCMFKLQQLSQICKAYLQKVLCFSVKTHTRSCFCRSTSTTVRLCQSFLFRRWLYLLQQGWWWWWTLKVLCIHVWGLLCRTVPWQHRTGGGGSSLVNELRQLRAYKSSDAPRKITTIIIISSSSNRLQPASASVRYHWLVNSCCSATHEIILPKQTARSRPDHHTTWLSIVPITMPIRWHIKSRTCMSYVV